VLSGEGKVEKKEVVPEYRKRIAGDIQLERPLRVVIDCGNGVGGVCAADVLRDIGAEVLPLFDEVDGTFPNHHPDPSDPHNLKDLIESVRLMNADLGLALDGDADRLGVVTLGGNIIFPDRVMMLLAMDVLTSNAPGIWPRSLKLPVARR
jgi:phosphomannomutase/phosphoglucomutase